MRKPGAWTEYAEVAGLFYLQAMAGAMWLVPLSRVLGGHGLQNILPYAFACTAIGAIISPLVFGAMADRHTSPSRVLRWLAVASAVAMTLQSTAIQRNWNPWLVLALIQLQALCSTPTTSISTAIVLAKLRDARTEFGPVRAMATIGWMCGCWTVSALNADASVRSGYTDAVVWLVLAAFTFLLPSVTPPKSLTALTLRQRLGWDALALLKNHDHRVVFVTAALFCIPLAAFYPFTPPQLLDLGLKHTSAWMTLGQVSEVICMLSLATLLARWRLKWIFAFGLAFGVLRFGLCALNTKAWVLAGVAMHGFSIVLFIITAQVYIDQRVPSNWRVRGQALMSLMTTGIGNLLGFLGSGLWFNACARSDGTLWPLFWSGLSAAVAAVLIYFLIAYHGRSSGLAPMKPAPRSGADDPARAPAVDSWVQPIL